MHYGTFGWAVRQPHLPLLQQTFQQQYERLRPVTKQETDGGGRARATHAMLCPDKAIHLLASQHARRVYSCVSVSSHLSIIRKSIWNDTSLCKLAFHLSQSKCEAQHHGHKSLFTPNSQQIHVSLRFCYEEDPKLGLDQLRSRCEQVSMGRIPRLDLEVCS